VLSGTSLAEEGRETIVVVARGVVQSTIGLHDGSIGKMLAINFWTGSQRKEKGRELTLRPCSTV
jgi:hypothetical protein